MVQPVPWYVVVLITIPQTYLIMAIGFSLFNLKIEFKRCLAISIVFALVCFYLRKLHISFELDTAILVVLLTVTTCLVFGIALRYCFISVLLGYLIYAVLESVSLPLFLKFTHLPLDVVLASPWLNILAFLPIFILLSLVLWWIKSKPIAIYDFSRISNINA